MIKKSRLILFMAFFVLCFSGCSKKSDYEEQLPEIVFITITDNSEISTEGETIYEITFIDKNGNQYVTSDPDVMRLGYKELIEKYSQGDLDGKIKLLEKSYDSSLIEDNYNKLREAALNEDVSIEYPQLYPDVQAVRKEWSGIIYGKDGSLEDITLHCEERMSHCYSKSDIVNSVYNEIYVKSNKNISDIKSNENISDAKSNENISDAKLVKKGAYYDYKKRSYLWIEDEQSLSYCPEVFQSSSIEYHYEWKGNKIIGTSDWRTLVIEIVDNEKLRLNGTLYFYESDE